MFERKSPKKSATKVELESVQVESTEPREPKSLVVKSRLQAGQCGRIHGEQWGG